MEHQHKKEIYLDNASTTQTDDDIAQCVLEVLTQRYGNPSSLHRKGLEAQLLVEQAVRELKSAIGALTGKVYFTSGGTEANNTAIFGAAYAHRRKGKGIVTTAAEHSSVIDSVKQLESEGFDCHITPPLQNGGPDLAAITAACDGDTILVSVMAVNNEVGTITDLPRLIREVRQKSPNALIHVDAVQALGKIPLKASSLGVDLMSISGHKIYAPKGIGALYIADKLRIKPLLYGGAQQDRLRPGTENTAYIAALGMAAAKANRNLQQTLQQVTALRGHLLNCLEGLPYVVLNSDQDASPYITNISLPGLRSETVLHFLEEYKIYLSSGSACSKGAGSHVLRAMGLPPGLIDSALRISLSKHTTMEDIDQLIAALAVADLRLIRKR